MNKEECYEVGRIIKPHGLKGEVQILLDVSNPAEYTDMDAVLVEMRGELIPYFIEKIQIRSTVNIVKFEGINTPEEALKLKNAKLYLPDDLLDELAEGEYYFHDLLGCMVTDVVKGDLGTVQAVYELPSQNVMGVSVEGKEVLIPIVDEIVQNVDTNNKTIKVALPEGLLEVYLEEQAKED
jgi:16S rRNA processing protein RimM